jgi:alkanesulfonate monooxygenase SsuD/methylene tetrahydromethanopterin reductase-like flavin-dependent oxidoreductase (luciferase family)
LGGSEWRQHGDTAAAGRSANELPLLGVNRHIIIADTEAEALDTARRGYPAWRHHMGQLWRKYNVPFPLEAALPEDFAVLQQHGDAIAGTPAQVRDYIAGEIKATGVNYYVCDFAFGTISHDEAMRSISLFTQEVMPAFADA